MTDAERAWVRYLEDDIAHLQSDVRELKAKIRQQSTVINNLWAMDESLRAAAFGDQRQTSH